MKETTVEAYLFKQVKRAGGMCIKFVPVVAGVPDRIVLLPGGRIFLIELKRPGVRVLRPSQKVWHARAAKIGFSIPVLSSRPEVDAWLQSVKE